MGVDLILLPIDHESDGWGFSHTVLSLERASDLWEPLRLLPEQAVPASFATYLGPADDDEPHYGDTQYDAYGERLSCTTADALWGGAPAPRGDAVSAQSGGVGLSGRAATTDAGGALLALEGGGGQRVVFDEERGLVPCVKCGERSAPLQIALGQQVYTLWLCHDHLAQCRADFGRWLGDWVGPDAPWLGLSQAE